MSTFTATTANLTHADTAPSFTLAGFIAALFMVNLRETLDADTQADAADAAYTWGM